MPKHRNTLELLKNSEGTILKMYKLTERCIKNKDENSVVYPFPATTKTNLSFFGNQWGEARKPLL